MQQAIDPIKLLGEKNIKHIRGNLYLVRRECILLPEPLNVSNSAFKFGNPRWFKSSNGKLIAKGIQGGNEDSSKIDELRNSIKHMGLEHPIFCRPKNNKLEVIDGERRTRCLDKLVKENIKCYDTSSQEMKPASEVYEWVECRIEDISDRKAIEIAMKKNDTGVDIGDPATLNIVRYLRKLKETDEEILKITGKSITWLREADELCALDDTTFTAYQNDEINRRLALQLSKIKDTKDRLARLDEVRTSAAARKTKLQTQLNKDIQETEDQLELAEAQQHVATLLGEDTKSAAKAAAKAAAKLATTKAKQIDLDGKAAKAGTKDLAGVQKPMTKAKIDKYWKADLQDIIQRNGTDRDGNDLRVSLDDAKLIMTILEKIDCADFEPDGKTPISILEILRIHQRKK